MPFIAYCPSALLWAGMLLSPSCALAVAHALPGLSRSIGHGHDVQSWVRAGSMWPFGLYSLQKPPSTCPRPVQLDDAS
jgi:hypothetical protein